MTTLQMGPGERYDLVVDFSSEFELFSGCRVQVIGFHVTLVAQLVGLSEWTLVGLSE